MVNPFIQTPAEKEEYVLEMIEGGYSYPQIMRECHVSPNTISDIKKKHGIVENDVSKSASKISKETQALKLFGEGKTLFQVATELDIDADNVFIIYQKFQRLRNNEAFISMYERIKGNMYPFLRFYDLINSLGMTPAQVAQLADCGIRLPYLWSIHSKLCKDTWILESQKRYLVRQVNNAQNHLEQFKASLEFYHKECEMKRLELFYLHSEIYKKTNIIKTLTDDNGYVTIKEAAKRETKLLMQNYQVSFAVTLTATLEAIRRYPNNDILLSDIVTSRCYSPTSNQKPWLESHAPKLLQLMQTVQDEMAELIAGKCINILESRFEQNSSTAA